MSSNTEFNSAVSSTPTLLPCVVQVGFSGARKLFDKPVDPKTERSLHLKIAAALTAALERIATELGFEERHFLCGISQIAIGGDMLFTRACRELNVPQQIFLPQHRDAFFDAVGADGTPDFSESEREEARALLQSSHIIHERLVSDAPDRSTRFEEANREIVRASDLVICLTRDGAANRAGGTSSFLQFAQSIGIPALELRLTWTRGEPGVESYWHEKDSFRLPQLPKAIEAVTLDQSKTTKLAGVGQFARTLKTHAAKEAKRSRGAFSSAAILIIGCHVAATLFATLVLVAHAVGEHPPPGDNGHGSGWVAVALVVELALLGYGLITHHRMHHSRPSQVWALSRLLAEINRSASAFTHCYMRLSYLFRLHLPADLRPLLRTLSVLHLNSCRATPADRPWRESRDHYLQTRLLDPDPMKGQIAYYKDRHRRDSLALKRANWVFKLCAALAFIATAVKLGITIGPHAGSPLAPSILGALAIVLPVLAVGALSWTAAQDYAARAHTYGEMADFLQIQLAALQNVSSAREFEHLAQETEFRLLGETVQWFTRRAFASVA